MKFKHLLCGLAATAAVLTVPAGAEDIDLFVGQNVRSQDRPNVLIVLDNTANWNTAFTNEIAALVSTVNGLKENRFNVGLMLFTETGNGNSNTDGAYVRTAIRPLTTAYKPKFAAMVQNLHILDDKSNGGKVSLAMWESYLYYSGKTAESGWDKNKADITGNPYTWAKNNAPTPNSSSTTRATWAEPGNALSSRTKRTYNAPGGSACAKNFIIYISNGAAQDNTSDTTRSSAALRGFGGDATTVPLSPSGSQDNMADEWTRFMKKDMDIVTYTVDVDKITTGQGPGWTALLKSMAQQSSGKYFDVSSAANAGSQISEALRQIFTEIQSVNSVFASVSLPVSVNTQGTYLNQVFIGMFRPANGAYPRWNGNLKQYKLGVSGSNILQLQDANSTSAVNSNTGFIAECARSFWTPTTTDTYWSAEPSEDACGTAPGATANAMSNSPDGNVVEKGAQAYVLRSNTTRKVLTCDVASDCGVFTQFVTGNTGITAAALGTNNGSERDNLINWSRGLNIAPTGKSQTELGKPSTDMRPSAHADVVHSRPVAINFGNTDADRRVVVFYGANDGMLKAVNGNRDTAHNSTAPGAELWSFMPPEFYPRIKRQWDNEQLIAFPNVQAYPPATGPTPAPKPYGMDGPMTAYQTQNRQTTWLFATMRRGGRALYAFDVSDPASPSILWRKGCPNDNNDTGCSTGFTGLGQTWSPAVPILVEGYKDQGKPAPLLIMGGGYAACEDESPHQCISSSKGRAVYVMDAQAGTLLRTFTTDRPVVGEVTFVTDFDTGLKTHGYVADMGGNLYQIKIGTDTVGNWGFRKVATLGCANSSTSCTEPRKFMFGPDVVVEGNNHILLLGSGDREKPLAPWSLNNTMKWQSAYDTTNYFFKVNVPFKNCTPSDCVESQITDLSKLLNVTGRTTTTTGDSTLTAATAADLAGKRGWYLSLRPHEQVVTSSITVLGTTTFSTHIPYDASTDTDVNVCRNKLGVAQVYNVAYLNGGGTAEELPPDVGLSPSPVAGKVTLDDGREIEFVIGGSGNSPLEAKFPGTASTYTKQPRKRAYWNLVR